MATETNKSAWISVKDQLPPYDIEVETMIDDADVVRNIRTLTLHNDLWWVPDMSMYVYYSPTHWRRKVV